MNLYSIDFAHYSPKDSEYGTKCLLLANNDEEVYEWIKSQPEGMSFFCSWKDHEEDGTHFDLFDDDYNEVGTETSRERIIKNRGDIDNDDMDYGDAYYGITLYGWELLVENTTADYTELLETKFLKTIN